MEQHRHRSRAGMAVGIGIAFVAVAVAAAAVFTNRQGSAIVAQHGTTALRAEAVLGAASSARNGAAQTLLIWELGGASVDTSAALERLATLKVGVDARVVELIEQLDPDAATDVQFRRDRFIASLDGFARAFESDTPRAAAEDVDRTYRDLTALVTEIRAVQTSELVAAGADAGRVADAARFFVAFFIPLGAVLAFRRRARREQERDALQLQLEKERDVGRAKDEFIANLSHELRTPLTGIYGFALTLESDGLDEPLMARELVGLIADESAELTRMVDDLIAVGRLENGDLDFFPEVVHPKEALDAVLAAYVRSGRSFDVDLADDPILVDPGRLRQVLRNLISNAVKHGGPNITITGQAAEDGLESSYQIEVIDDGDGVPDHVVEKIFERYVHRGTQPLLAGSVGLGLAIAHSFVAGMGGTLTYERRSGKTVFQVGLPLASDRLENAKNISV